MTKPVLEKKHVREAIKRARKNGNDWLYDEYRASLGSPKRSAVSWFLLDPDSDTLFPIKALGRLAHEIAGKPIKRDGTKYFSDCFSEAGFDVVDSKEEAKEAKRRRQKVEVLSRPEQAKFRREVFKRHGYACILSGCKARAALEAAHIVSVSDSGKDIAANGIPLRADLHRLFDANQLNIYPDGRVTLDPEAAKSYPGSKRWRLSATQIKLISPALRERSES